MKDDIKLPPLPDIPDDNGRYGHGDMKRYASAAIKADRQQRGEPEAWVKQDIAENQFINMRPRRIWWECNEGIGMPIYSAPQPADINIDYKQLYEQMCERCDMLDAKLAEYSEQPTPAAQGPSAGQIIEAVETYGDACRQSNISVSEQEMRLHGIRAMLAAAPKFGEKE